MKSLYSKNFDKDKRWTPILLGIKKTKFDIKKYKKKKLSQGI